MWLTTLPLNCNLNRDPRPSLKIRIVSLRAFAFDSIHPQFLPKLLHLSHPLTHFTLSNLLVLLFGLSEPVPSAPGSTAAFEIVKPLSLIFLQSIKMLYNHNK